MTEPEVMRSLKRKGWRYVIRWSKAWQGYCEPEEKRISINVMKIIASVIVHENTHALDTKEVLTEGEVLLHESLHRASMERAEAEAIVREFSPELCIAIQNLTRR